ncbi:MFS transporter [Actinomycetospora rhizophila]|uniref:MFS transporter n=1 Tax=Actinomycetospora rhizophila TaxID=1416876 RepID=A0ABV9ZGH1_9PSEU
MPSSGPGRDPATARRIVLAIALCTIFVDGYDLFVHGTVTPALLAYREWGLTPPDVGLIGAVTFAGMLVGALGAGVLTDVLGRRRILIWAVVLFSVAMGVSAAAPTPLVFGAARFVAGIGLGGVTPTAIALAVEFAPAGRRQMYNAVACCGGAFGGVIAALVGVVVIPALGFRAMFWIGTLPLLVLLPLALRLLPESPSYLLARGRPDEARRIAERHGLLLEEPAEDPGSPRRSFARLFARHRLRPTLLFAGASFCGLLLAYGLGSWLPAIMARAGYGLGPSILFLLALNLGAIGGALAGARLADRIGSKPVVVSAFCASALAIGLLGLQPPVAVSYVLVAVAGMGSIGAQFLVNGYVAALYPAAVRASALGWANGIGRLGAILGPYLGGIVLGAALGLAWNFWVFAVVAALGALVCSALPATRPAVTPPVAVIDDEQRSTV